MSSPAVTCPLCHVAQAFDDYGLTEAAKLVCPKCQTAFLLTAVLAPAEAGAGEDDGGPKPPPKPRVPSRPMGATAPAPPAAGGLPSSPPAPGGAKPPLAAGCQRCGVKWIGEHVGCPGCGSHDVVPVDDTDDIVAQTILAVERGEDVEAAISKMLGESPEYNHSNYPVYSKKDYGHYVGVILQDMMSGDLTPEEAQKAIEDMTFKPNTGIGAGGLHALQSIRGEAIGESQASHICPQCKTPLVANRCILCKEDISDKQLSEMERPGFMDDPERYKMPSGTYKIVRHRFNKPSRVVQTGLSLEQAQAHCSDPKTHGEGWFDGYIKESVDGSADAALTEGDRSQVVPIIQAVADGTMDVRTAISAIIRLMTKPAGGERKPKWSLESTAYMLCPQCQAPLDAGNYCYKCDITVSETQLKETAALTDALLDAAELTAMAHGHRLGRWVERNGITESHCTVCNADARCDQCGDLGGQALIDHCNEAKEDTWVGTLAAFNTKLQAAHEELGLSGDLGKLVSDLQDAGALKLGTKKGEEITLKLTALTTALQSAADAGFDSALTDSLPAALAAGSPPPQEEAEEPEPPPMPAMPPMPPSPVAPPPKEPMGDVPMPPTPEPTDVEKVGNVVSKYFD